MDVVSLYLGLIANPFVPKPYRELAGFYEQKGMLAEARAFSALVDKCHETGHPNNQEAGGREGG